MYIPGPSQRADAQTKILTGQALKTAQQDLIFTVLSLPVFGTVRIPADPSQTGQVPNVRRDAARAREGYRQSSGWCSPIQQSASRVVELITLVSQITPQAKTGQLSTYATQKPVAKQMAVSSLSTVKATAKHPIIKQKPSTKAADGPPEVAAVHLQSKGRNQCTQAPVETKEKTSAPSSVKGDVVAGPEPSTATVGPPKAEFAISSKESSETPLPPIPKPTTTKPFLG